MRPYDTVHLDAVGFHQEFFGTLGGADYSFDKRDAETALFELKDAVDSAACGRSDHVLEKRGVIAGFERDFGCAECRLCGEHRGEIARKAGLHAAFG